VHDLGDQSRPDDTDTQPAEAHPYQPRRSMGHVSTTTSPETR
jgi:hypothetical protein